MPQRNRQEAAQVLDALVEARLLTEYDSAGGAERGAPGSDDSQVAFVPEHGRHVEIVHESLLEAWPRLVRWRAQEEEGAILRDQLRQAARLWESRGRAEELLWTGRAHDEYRVWRSRYAGRLTAPEEAFATAMAERAGRRRRRRRIAAAGVISLALGVAAVTTLLWRRSETAGQRAREETLRAEASELLALAQLRRGEDPTEALALTTASLERANSREARLFALRLLWDAPPAFETELGNNGHYYTAFSRDGAWLAAAGSNAEVPVWSETGERIAVLPGNDPRQANQIAWGPGNLLLSGPSGQGPGGTVHVWSLPEGKRLRTIERGRRWWFVGAEHLLAEAIGEDERGHEIFTLRSWRLPRGSMQELGRIDWTALGASMSVFLPNGRGWLYARDRGVYLRPLPAGDDHRDRLVGRHPAEVTALWPLRSDPQRVYSEDRTGEMRIWDLSRSEPTLATVIPPWNGQPRQRFPDSSERWLAQRVPEDAEVRLWDVTAWPTARPLHLQRRGSWLGGGVTFEPKDRWLVAVTQAQSRLTFWPLLKVRPIVIDGHSFHAFPPLAFDPHGRWLATMGLKPVEGFYRTNTLTLWPLPGSGSREVKTLTLPQTGVWTWLAFDPQARHIVGTGNFGTPVFVVPLDGSPARRLEGLAENKSGAAVSPSGRQVATAKGQGPPNALQVWDVETGERRVFDLPESTSASGTAFERGVSAFAFGDESTLYTAGDGGVRRWNLESGAHEVVFAAEPGVVTMSMAVGGNGPMALVREMGTEGPAECRPVKLLDLSDGTWRSLPAFGECPTHDALGLDAAGDVAATGDMYGVVRVGSVSGGEPHLLLGHDGPVHRVALSPDGRWVASAGEDNTVRLWPMPDLTKPPLHTLPHDELMAKLKSLTNLRAVRDPDAEGGWTVELAPFPGWKDVPEW